MILPVFIYSLFLVQSSYTNRVSSIERQLNMCIFRTLKMDVYGRFIILSQASSKGSMLADDSWDFSDGWTESNR